MVKEDASIPVICFGLYMLFSNTKKHGIITALIGVVWLVVSVELIIPYYRSLIGKQNYGFWTYWADYGTTQREIILGMLNPFKNFQVLFKPEKLSSMFNYFSVFLFLPFGTLKAFIFLVFPNWFLLFSSNNSMMYNAINYYGLLSLPFLFYSSLLTLLRINAKFSSKKALAAIIILLVVINAANSRYWKLFAETPMKYSDRYETVKNIIVSLPHDASISAQGNLVGHIPPREKRFFFPQNTGEVDYILLDQKGDKWPLNETDYKVKVESLINGGTYIAESDDSGFLLFKLKK